VPEGMTAVKSPMVGTFYRAPSPGAPPFVEVGQKVHGDTVVCIIEVMKLMNSVAAGVNGTVQEIRVADSQAVAFGEVLIVIQPDG
jgi:acetyl-CoA carboxylase biotin carboxyl carrier protein